MSEPAYQRLFAESAELTLVAHGAGQVLRSGRPLEFRGHHACRAVFLLALAGPDGVHVEQLAESLWPGAGCDHRRLLGRVRTLLWQVREGLGPHSWRLRRDGPIISLDLAGAVFDVARTRADAHQLLRDRPGEHGGTRCGERGRLLAARLRGPLLTRWAYEEWVLAEVERNDLLADQLDPQPTDLDFDARLTPSAYGTHGAEGKTRRSRVPTGDG